MKFASRLHHLPTALLSIALLAATFGSFAVAEEEPSADSAGQTVVGKVVLPAKNAKEEVDFSVSRGRLMTKIVTAPIPYPKDLTEIKEKVAWQKEWLQSDDGKAWLAKQREARAAFKKYDFKLNENGSFEIEGVAPGSYTLVVSVARPNAREVLGGLQKEGIVVKEAGVELGELPLQIAKVVRVGDDAPAVVAETFDGKELKLSDYRGKYVLIDFWATWCGPCLREIPNIQKIHETYGDHENFAVIGFSIDKEIGLPEAYAKKTELGYQQAFLGVDTAGRETLNEWGVRGIPSIWLVGPDGKVVGAGLRGAAMEEAVKQALKPAKAPAAEATEEAAEESTAEPAGR